MNSEFGSSDSYVVENDEEGLQSLCGTDDVWRIATMVNFGEWNPTHDYLTLDGYGNLKSSDDIERLIDTDIIINNIYEQA